MLYQRNPTGSGRRILARHAAVGPGSTGRTRHLACHTGIGWDRGPRVPALGWPKAVGGCWWFGEQQEGIRPSQAGRLLLSREVSAGEVHPAIPAMGSRGAREAPGSAGWLGLCRPRLARCRTRTGHRVALAVRAAGGGGRGAFVCAGAACGGSAGSTRGNAGGYGGPG